MRKFINLNLLLLAVLLPLFSTSLHARVLNGIDVLEKSNYSELRGRKIALITNQTGINMSGISTVDLFVKAKLDLKCIMSPEHGFRGTVEHGQAVEQSTDPKTGLPIYSLYGATPRPTDAMLKDVDTLVYDIQDIGVRFYTYITTMGWAMEEAAQRNISFVVLDRPNPLRGDMIEGDVLDFDVKRHTGYYTIPTRYGLTIGELALWYNETAKIGADLSVIKLQKWKRSNWMDETGLKFIPPSPNIPNLMAALLYTGVGCFEATNVAVGRGTDSPFELFGAPWINPKALCTYLRGQNFEGVLFEPVEFIPEKDVYAGEKCFGVKMLVTSRR